MTASAIPLQRAHERSDEDEQLLLRFVIWHLRVRDLPANIRDAASRLVETGRHPRITPLDEYLDAPYRVSALPREEDAPAIDISTDRAGVAGAVSELLIVRPQYVVVTDLLTPDGQAIA